MIVVCLGVIPGFNQLIPVLMEVVLNGTSLLSPFCLIRAWLATTPVGSSNNTVDSGGNPINASADCRERFFAANSFDQHLNGFDQLLSVVLEVNLMTG